MSELREKQSRFVLMVAELITYAYSQGYELTFGDCYRDPRCHGHTGFAEGYGSADSLHKQRLAADFNLFRDGKYLTKTEDHRKLGKFWESLGGEWGGSDGRGDANHYSLGHDGRW